MGAHAREEVACVANLLQKRMRSPVGLGQPYRLKGMALGRAGAALSLSWLVSLGLSSGDGLSLHG